MATKKKPAKRPVRRRAEKSDPTVVATQNMAEKNLLGMASAPRALTQPERAEDAGRHLEYVIRDRDRVIRQARDLRDALKALAKVFGRNGYMSLDG